MGQVLRGLPFGSLGVEGDGPWAWIVDQDRPAQVGLGALDHEPLP